MASDFPTTGYPPMIGKRLNIDEWRTYVTNYNFGSIAPSRVVLHHTYRPTEQQWRGLASMRGMQQYYAGLGWSAAPHVYVAEDGIWLFTPMSRVGVHAGTGNGSVREGWYSIGLETVGAFDNQRPDGQTWEYAKAVMGELSRRLRIPPRRLISFHRDYTNLKSCPGRAVTKDWVWGEVEAWVNNAAPPPAPPQGQIGTPTPSNEHMLEALLNQTYSQRGQGYNAEWAFHQYAVEQNLGAPFGKSTRLSIAGKDYNYQPFARDTLFCEVPNWGDVQTLSKLLGGSIPPSGLGRTLLEETYKAGGSAFRPDWAFHQFAIAAKLGPPLGRSGVFVLDGKQYSFQVFATDTLYNQVPNWSDVQQLSRLKSVSDTPRVRLRETLLAKTYQQAGTDYHPEWSFHQFAQRVGLGAALSGSFKLKIDQTEYALQVYALDTLYNQVPNWSDVRRMGTLVPGREGAAVLGAVQRASAEPAVLGASVEAEEQAEQTEHVEHTAGQPPAAADSPIVRYNPPSPAWSDRNGAVAELVVLHAIPGAAADTLQQMTTFGTRFAVHYYVGLDGTIWQLVDEQDAAWHAGMATLDGTWFNLNRISLGVGLERPLEWPDLVAETPATQTDALEQLLRTLGTRYDLAPGAVMLWSSFAGSDEQLLEDLPIGVLRRAIQGR